MKSLLQLEDYWVDDLAIKDGVEAPKSRDTVLPTIRYEIYTPAEEAPSEESERHLVKITVSAGRAKVQKGIPYQFRIQLSGVFSIDSQLEDETKGLYLFHNAPAMLYGIARGIIGEVTASGRHERYILPSINFVELNKRQRRRPVL